MMKWIACYISVLLPCLVYAGADTMNDSSSAMRYSRLAIKPARTMSIATTEGSNMNVDVSAADQSIVFDLLGELFVLPAGAERARQITEGLAVNRKPVWSPDGKRIAYVSDATGDRRLHVRSMDNGKNEVVNPYGAQLLESYNQPVWLNDRCIAVFKSMYFFNDSVSPLPVPITELLGSSNNGNILYYKEDVENNEWKINAYDTRTGRITLLTKHSHSQGNFINAKVSPEGRWLTFFKGDVYAGIDSLMVFDATTGQERLLAHVNIKYPGPLSFQHYSFSGDSKKLFIAYGGKIHRIDILTGENNIVPFSAEVKVATGPINFNRFPVMQDSLSVGYLRYTHRRPDGKQMVFAALNRIYVKSLVNGKINMLVRDSRNQFQPSYSPDGKWIAYVSWEDTIGGHVWRIKSSGGTAEKLTASPGQYQHPAWSPDGKYIVACEGNLSLGIRDNPGNGDIVLIDIVRRTKKIIARHVPLFNHPCFSADGKSIIYKPAHQYDFFDTIARPKLVSQRISDSSIVVVAVGKKGELVATALFRDIFISPDQRFIVYFNNENLLLVPTNNFFPALIYDPSNSQRVYRFARAGFDPHWEDGGRTLSWSYGNQYFRINPEKIIAAASRESIDDTGPNEFIDVDTAPDECITIDLKAKRFLGAGAIALTGAKIISMKGDEIIENGTIIIRDGRILQIGSSKHKELPKNIVSVNCTGKTIIPGLIDMHDHMGVPPDLFPQQSWMYLANLAYGVTTARDPSGSHDMFGYEELLQTGQMIGPRLFNVGHAVKSQYHINSLEEARLVVNNRKRLGATVIKQYSQDTRLQRQWLSIACREAGLNMTNEGGAIIPEYIAMIKDGSTGVEHNPIWGEIYSDVIQLVVKSGVYICPTLQVSYSRQCPGDCPKVYFHNQYIARSDPKYNRFIPPDVRKQWEGEMVTDTVELKFRKEASVDARIVRAGGRIVMGSHGEDKGIGAHFELWALQMGGLSNIEALRAATLTGAEALGMQKDLGSLEPGKIADLIILDKNPLDDIHNSTSIKYVMKDGVLYDGDTLNEVWPVRKKLPEWKMKQSNAN